MTKNTKNADRNQPEKTRPSCFAPDVCRTQTGKSRVVGRTYFADLDGVHRYKESTTLAHRGTTGKVGVTREEPQREAWLIVRVTVEAYVSHCAAGDALTSARAHSPLGLEHVC